MRYAVELDFDVASCAALAALSKEIHTRFGGMDLTMAAAQPHISLATLVEPEPARLLDQLAALAASTAPMPRPRGSRHQ